MLDMLEGSLPNVAVGGHCNTPRDCPFFERCWPDDQNHVRHLYNAGPAKAGSLMEKGIHSIIDLPESGKLSDIVRRQKRALRGGRMIVEDGLAGALGEFEPPIGYLDFETVGRAVPLWDGVKPWEPVPAQFSYHEVAADGSIRHVEWLADGPGDPRPGIARALVEAIGPVDRVVTYASGFELGCIRRLGKAVSELSGQLDELETRIVDLLPVVRDHIYHPDFHGSFSLKPVLAALVPDLAYDDLRIGGGQLASIELSRLMLNGQHISSRVRRTLRRALLDYCKRDTMAMVALLRELRRIALAPANSSPR
jgi:hypothetical protein